jgi:predicted AlkP superfamily phosphohydrolase/phosphomutase
MKYRRVIVIGLDGLDPSLCESLMDAGELPNLAGLRHSGGYTRVATTLPAQTPVAWSTFAVGANPGAHGIFDFLRRDPRSYLPEIALSRHEQKSRFLPPRAVNLRGGRTVWEMLSDAGIPSVILRHPCTYPPSAFRGRLLAGIGVPDLRGGFGSTSYYSSDTGLAAGEGEQLFRVKVDGSGRATIELHGPLLPQGDDLLLQLALEVDAATGSALLRSPREGLEIRLEMKRWSPWVHVRFKHGPLQSARGMVRFFLAGTSPLGLFASPVNFDPDSPLFPISHPWDYAGALGRVIGAYATLGLAEAHAGLANGRFDEAAFLAQCLDVLGERHAMMRHELELHDRGLFYCLFDTPDRVQHMFWRFGEPAHPANAGQPPCAEMARVIPECYRTCDQVVGEALQYAGQGTLVIVLSDHGFASFQRAVDLNAWLYRNGYLHLREGVEPGEEAGDLLRQVDWARTHAYALGLAGLFLNVSGREAQGIVPASQAMPLAEEIAGRLTGLPDCDRNQVAIRTVLPRERVYQGAYLDQAPDLLVGYASGYRTASATAMGGVGSQVISDNTGRWSGDHVVDPVLVPGVLFMNAPLRSAGARLTDLAPTILEALGAPLAPTLEGRSLL